MRRYYILSITILAFVIRFISLLLLSRHINPEIWEYESMAVSMLQKKGFIYTNLNTVYHSFSYPGYVMLTAIFHFLTNHNFFILELFQILLASITCFIVYLIAKIIFSEEVGLLSAFLFSTHPGLIIYSTKMHELTLVVFLFVFIFWLMLVLDYKKIYK